MQFDRQEAMRLAVALPQIHERAMRAGLLRTGHKLHAAVQEIGWEIATLATLTAPEGAGATDE